MRRGIACVVVAMAGCGRIAFDPLGGSSGDGGGSSDDAGIPTGSYTRTIVLTAGVDLPDGYSISFTLDHAALVASGKSLADGSDLGVVLDGDLDRVLDAGSQWNTNTTRIWFRTQSAIPAGTNTDYTLVYGRGAVATLENPDRVFVFADDFEAGNSRWQVGAGTWTTSMTAAHRGAAGLAMTGPLAGQNRWIEASGVAAADVACEAYWRVTGAAGNDLGQGVRSAATTSPRHYLINLEQANGLVLAKDSATGFQTLSGYVTPPVANAWTRVAIMINGRNARVRINEVQTIPAAGSIDVGTELTSGSVSLYAFQLGNAQSWFVDDLIVRKYVDPEPSATLGPEMQN